MIFLLGIYLHFLPSTVYRRFLHRQRIFQVKALLLSTFPKKTVKKYSLEVFLVLK